MEIIFRILVISLSSIIGLVNAGICQLGCTCMNDPSAPSVICDGTIQQLQSIPIVFNPRIRSLTLSNNLISSVTLDELSFYTELEFLDLSNNKIDKIERGVFYRLQKLKALRLNNNELIVLDVEAFAGLNELRALDLSGNKLKRLATSVFSDLRSLETLNVSKNSITQISPGAFTGLTSLKELHLQHNQLSVMPKIALHAPQSLKILDLSYNQVQTIGDESFIHLKQLESLNLAGNQLDIIEENAFSGLRNLRSLYLDTNRLHRVPTISFRPLTELDTLSLSENFMDELTTSAFEGLARLRQLTISRCPQLKSVSVNAFSGLFALETLILTENHALSNIDPMAFELLQRSRVNQAKLQTSLREFYVFGNNFTSLPSTLLPWRQLNELDLRFNPWSCHCEFASWIGRALRRIYGQRGSFPDGATCHVPQSLKGYHLHTIRGYSSEPVEEDDYDWTDLGQDTIELAQCQSAWSNGTIDLVITILAVLACLLTLTIVIWLCVRYRRRLREQCTCCCCSTGVSPLKSKPPPPGLPELFKYNSPQHVDRDQGFYSGQYMVTNEMDGIYAEEEDQMDIAKQYPTPNGFGYVTYEYPVQRAANYSGYGQSAEETQSFLPRTSKKSKNARYSNTSDYYSGFSSNASHSPPESSSSSQISPGSGATTHHFNRAGSFRVIQRYPIPITEL